MKRTVRWLHISDFHVGLDITAQSLHFDKVIEHIAETQASGFFPDTIFVTGDVGNTGTAQEYSTFRSGFLNKLAALENPPRVIIVPGNHDLVRPQYPQQYNRDFLSNEQLCRHYDPSESGLTSRRELVAHFENFRTLPDCEWLKSLEGYRHIPGNDDYPVDLLCFNTSWIAWGSDAFDEEGHLPIGVTAIENAFSKLTPGNHLIVLGHHPISWLSKPSRDSLIRELRKRGGLYLCGHEHQAQLDAYSSFDKEAYQLRAGAAFLGRVPNGQDWTNSLIWGELQTTELDGVKLRVRPRHWSNANGWHVWTSNFVGDPTDGGWFEYSLKRSSAAEQKSRYALTTTAPIDTFSYKSINAHSDLADPKNLETYLEILSSQFEFTYQKTSRSQPSGDYVVFWPVRARQPTLVHAMQAFSAAGLTKFGARVLLVLDDLSGHQNIQTADLEGAIERWFRRVGANPSTLTIFKLSAMQSEINQGECWINLITKWFAFQTDYKLGKILAVSKLEENKLSDKKARKLLTPTLIWSAFNVLMAKNKESRFVTLGGADERALWEAWRVCIDGRSVANHLFNPEVKDERQQRFDLDRIGWSAFIEIRDTLLECFRSYQGDLSEPPTSWLPFVAYKSCVVLPARISGQRVDEWETLVATYGKNKDELARRLADSIYAWFLRDI